jgi:hypothetical protein
MNYMSTVLSFALLISDESSPSLLEITRSGCYCGGHLLLIVLL